MVCFVSAIVLLVCIVVRAASKADLEFRVVCAPAFDITGWLSDTADYAKMVDLAVGETAMLLHPALPSVGISIGMERGCQQSDRHATG